jgi:NTP pyrophosphatase (non-canonical NTP hydrolase)
MDLTEAQKSTAELVGKIEKRTGKPWDPKVRFIDLMEEAGELANALLIEEGFKAEKRRRADLVDSVCDMLFDLLMLAEHFKIDLSEEYGRVLKHVEGRLENGELTD